MTAPATAAPPPTPAAHAGESVTSFFTSVATPFDPDESLRAQIKAETAAAWADVYVHPAVRYARETFVPQLREITEARVTECAAIATADLTSTAKGAQEATRREQDWGKQFELAATAGPLLASLEADYAGQMVLASDGAGDARWPMLAEAVAVAPLHMARAAVRTVLLSRDPFIRVTAPILAAKLSARVQAGDFTPEEKASVAVLEAAAVTPAERRRQVAVTVASALKQASRTALGLAASVSSTFDNSWWVAATGPLSAPDLAAFRAMLDDSQ